MQAEVVELWRYPVKSMLGERCTSVALEPRGVAADRSYAVRDVDGKLGSGKHTRRFTKIDGLLRFRAGLEDGIPLLHFPGGRAVRADHPQMDRLLSDALGQTVSLAREGEVPHMDAGPVHIVSTGSLQRLRESSPDDAADARRFRPNIVVSLPGDRPELALIGTRVRIGDAELEIVDATERCGMVTFAQEGLPGAPRLLRHIADHWDGCFGVYARVLVPGAVRVGDTMARV